MTAAGRAAAPTPRLGLTLGDALYPGSLRERAPAWARDASLVAAGVALLIVGAYVSFTVPAVQLGQLFVPVNEYVPLTLQTFGVLFTGALLGTRRGVAATGIYLLIGIVGFPVFSADAEGIHRSGLGTFLAFDGGRVVLGSTGGYLVGFLMASAVVGGLAERGWDRRLGSSLAAMVTGTAVVYAFGVTWLAFAANLDIATALTFGLWPFLPGDILKLLVAAGLLPLGWRLVSRRASDEARGGSAPRA
jgi:biotin transport system substrate-specific component